jgi:hypothetical protein
MRSPGGAAAFIRRGLPNGLGVGASVDMGLRLTSHRRPARTRCHRMDGEAPFCQGHREGPQLGAASQTARHIRSASRECT